jgi:hypothetical protein
LWSSRRISLDPIEQISLLVKVRFMFALHLLALRIVD